MSRTAVLLWLQIAACWPVWQWYANRLAAGNADDQWCLLAAVTALAFLWHERKTAVQSVAPAANWLLPTVLMLLYALTFHWLPPLLRAVLAVSALGVTMSHCCLGRPLRPAVGGLLFLSLPVLPLLQFYLGYPLRVVVGAATAPLLHLAGLAVVREGTCLNWNGQLISIDAPCSGIKMLWAGLFLLCTVAGGYRLQLGSTMLAALFSLVLIVAGNILRASALFYLEAGIVHWPRDAARLHEGIGLVTFACTAISLVASVRWLQHRSLTYSGLALSVQAELPRASARGRESLLAEASAKEEKEPSSECFS